MYYDRALTLDINNALFKASRIYIEGHTYIYVRIHIIRSNCSSTLKLVSLCISNIEYMLLQNTSNVLLRGSVLLFLRTQLMNIVLETREL